MGTEFEISKISMDFEDLFLEYLLEHIAIWTVFWRHGDDRGSSIRYGIVPGSEPNNSFDHLVVPCVFVEAESVAATICLRLIGRRRKRTRKRKRQWEVNGHDRSRADRNQRRARITLLDYKYGYT